MTISQVKEDLAGMTHGTTLNKVTNLSALLNRAGRNLLSQIDPAGTRRIVGLTNPIHQKVYDYALPTDLKGNKIIDIRKQVLQGAGDELLQTSSREFSLRKELESGKFQVKYDDAVKSIRINANTGLNPITLDEINSVDGNGEWIAGGDASNLTADTVYYVSGGASLNFDLAASGSSGYIYNSTLTSVDLSDHEDKSVLFAWVYFPDASIITSVTLAWGSSSTALWNKTSTTQHDGTAFVNGWNLLSFDWSTATEMNTPDSSAIDYLSVIVAYDGTAETDIRVDSISSSLGRVYEIEYYSSYLFRNSSGTWIERTTSDSDILNLDTDAYNLYLYEAQLAIAQQLQGEDSPFDVTFIRSELHGDNQRQGLYQKYKASHPSEAIKIKYPYYRV